MKLKRNVEIINDERKRKRNDEKKANGKKEQERKGK